MLPLNQRTLVLIKPDGVRRGLASAILARIESAGLKLVALKMVHADRAFVEEHYPNTAEWIRGMGEKTLKSYRDQGLDPVQQVGTADPMRIGEMVKGWNIDYLSSGPVVAAVVEGPHAIEAVRKLCGHTLPLYAEPGTIRGTYSTESPLLANAEQRAIRNLIHASSTPEEVEHEVRHWFPEGGIVRYPRSDLQ
ncbi:MAG TPA: nucleoside-diphosphate kinase [Bacillota bacterium]|nr:nucleoside-diphosphate kinase [Bacillota bacterium]